MSARGGGPVGGAGYPRRRPGRDVRPLWRQGRPEREQGRDLRGADSPAHRHDGEVPARAHAGPESPDRARPAGREAGDRARRPRQRPRPGDRPRAAPEAPPLAPRQAEDAGEQARPVRHEGAARPRARGLTGVGTALALAGPGKPLARRADWLSPAGPSITWPPWPAG